MTSTIKVNTVTTESGSTLTLGESGKTIALASGASQTGFGRTGTVDWQTTIKTANFTAVSGEGYFCDTNSVGAFTLTLPASPSAGAIVSLADYANTFDTANLTIGRNSSNIEGAASDLVLNTEGVAVTLIYADSTKGWIVTSTGNSTDTQTTFMSATGGTVTESGNYKIHTFTGPGTFTVSSLSNVAANNMVDYLVVGGGASGGSSGGSAQGGGGAGGFRVSNDTCMPAPLTSPLANTSGIEATESSFPIVVGAGGAAASPNNRGTSGAVSSFSTITSAGGGGGGQRNQPPSEHTGVAGGSGGGGSGNAPGDSTTYAGGAGNTPPVSPPQGNPGGSGRHVSGSWEAGGGGGGAGAAGGDAIPGGGSGSGGCGGIGSFVVQTGFAGCNGTTGPVTGARYFAGGGGGMPNSPGNPQGLGGSGGGGPAQPNSSNAGTANTGGGGAAGADCNNSGQGGSGIVIIRYQFQ
jgi:hypothetical protein